MEIHWLVHIGMCKCSHHLSILFIGTCCFKHCAAGSWTEHLASVSKERWPERFERVGLWLEGRSGGGCTGQLPGVNLFNCVEAWVRHSWHTCLTAVLRSRGINATHRPRRGDHLPELRHLGSSAKPSSKINEHQYLPADFNEVPHWWALNQCIDLYVYLSQFCS